MNHQQSRRGFLKESVAGAAALTTIVSGLTRPSRGHASAAQTAGLKKSLQLGMLPRKLSLEDRCKLAKDVGFDGIEPDTVRDPKQVEAIRKAADKAGITIHSVVNSDHWICPLSSANADVVAKGMDCMKVSLQNAKDFGATAVLLVPAVVSPDIMYRDAYARSQKQIRELIPQAQELGVIIAVENVWNKFLLSPLEFARYVDEFESPFVRAYFDVGNVVLFGFPQDWIRTLGPRIAKIHLKDFKSDTKQFVPLREGSVNWPEVRKALAEIGYDGWLTTELDGGDEKYLRDVSARVDKIIAGT